MQSSPVSVSELEVLKVLWEGGPATVRRVTEVLAELGRDWAYTTVQTLLNRLCEKGAAYCDARGLAHVYEAAVTRDDLLRQRLNDLALAVCDGATAPVVQALVGGARFSAKEVAHFRELLDDLESRRKRRTRRGKR